jgi:hypothetical protein
MARDIAQKALPFKLEEGDRDDEVTGLAGLPIIHQFMKRSGLCRQIKKHLKLKECGWSEVALIETIVMLVAAGGEHLDDVRIFSADKALQQLLGKRKEPSDDPAAEEPKNAMGAIPSAKALERFLKLFHDEGQVHPGEGQAWVPEETAALRRLAEVNRWFVKRLIEQQKITRATIENDATAVASHKEGLFGMYKGGCGYMPVNGAIAELGCVAADEFRDGNCTPSYDVLRFFKETLKSLPESVTEICARLDGAYYNEVLIKFLQKKEIAFTITGRLSSSIVEWIRALPEAPWKPLQMVTKDGMRESGREWSEMPWGSANGSQEDIRKRVLRTVITRKKAHQWELWKGEHADAAEKDRYEVIVTNRDWEGDRLIRWHYERGGSIEHVHDRVKNDLAGHVLPCAEFGANAAWWRLQCLALNIVRAIQLEILPEEFRDCHLKRLRFHLFCIAGRVIRHAREIILKLSRGHPSFAMYREALTRIGSPAFS